MRPILQIIHASDIHFAGTAASASARQSLNRVKWPAWLRQKLFEGTQAHDSRALVEFERSVSLVLSREKQWRDKSWLILTGDLSTWGDDHAIDAVLAIFTKFAASERIAFQAIYGNHDVWLGSPGIGGVPWQVHRPNDFADRRTRLRAVQFPDTWPLRPINDRVSGNRDLSEGAGACRVTGYSLNTILHEPHLNLFAFGNVSNDRYWQRPSAPDQLGTLVGGCGATEFRIIFTHHPVHRPDSPVFGEVLMNQRDVAAALGNSRHNSLVGALVLSGHTHELFPALGALPPNMLQGGHDPLGSQQLQLTIGTLAQHVWTDPAIPSQTGGSPSHKSAQEHVWQRIRIAEDGGRLYLERVVFSRNGRTGSFKAKTDDYGNWAEHIQLT